MMARIVFWLNLQMSRCVKYSVEHSYGALVASGCRLLCSEYWSPMDWSFLLLGARPVALQGLSKGISDITEQKKNEKK